MNTHTIITDIHQSIVKTREADDSQNLVVSDTFSLGITERTLTTV